MEKTQALAYTTIAMSKLGYSRREIEQITNAMLEEFEVYTEGEAEDKADEIIFGDAPERT
ncbi:hypothetical protein EJF36_20385 [Bacillus sp. HMF5848]|uniref:hypothetical protein n=1 Tax=Bacillus sp. HMF5848 TaxID=2495421 RepID=UPI000F7795DD|nr:hypothetical protein [Bacillus sp. HMF5848]RSK29051.1 hypothetical protein EJF36_20385 [Bacillus sp. HMF5848]